MVSISIIMSTTGSCQPCVFLGYSESSICTSKSQKNWQGGRSFGRWLDYPNNLSKSHWEQRKKPENIQLKVFSKIANIAGYTHAGRTSLIITPTSSSRQCSRCNFSCVPSSVEAGRSASNSRCLAGLHFTPKFFPNVMRYNSHATLILSFASLLEATHSKSPQTCSCPFKSGLSELASAKSCCSSWTFWAAAASAVRRDWTCQVNNKQCLFKDKQISQIQLISLCS